MTADDKYSLLNTDNLKQANQAQLSQKQNFFSHFFFDFSNLVQILKIFKKYMTLIADVYPKLRVPKNMVNQCLKSPVWEDPSKSNMANGPKHCWNHNDSTFTILIDHCEGNWVSKSLS